MTKGPSRGNQENFSDSVHKEIYLRIRKLVGYSETIMADQHQLQQRSQKVKELARSQGFDFCGISRAQPLDREAVDLEEWLNGHRHGEMHYMANHFDKRTDPGKLLPGTRSIISVLLNYFPEPDQQQPTDAPKISKYAYGRDYHKVLKKKLKHLLQSIREEIGAVEGRPFVDSAPVMDKAWAQRSGLGWVGKHTNLLNRQMGSFFFIGELFVDMELAPDGPVKDYCGTCTRCVDACPTDALDDPYQIDGSKCISYLTIELKDAIPGHFKGQMEDWMFGCDICQDVCPWNRFARPHNTPDFNDKTAKLGLSRKEWEALTKEQFDCLFEGSAVKRTGYEGLKRNVEFLP